MATQLFQIPSQPGIQRDGTEFDSLSWIDGQWCRFYRGRPRKIGGYKRLITGINNVPRGAYMEPIGSQFRFYVGDQSSLSYVTVDQAFNVIGGPVSRTPALFPANPNYLWSFEVMWDDASNTGIFLAHPGANLADINNNVETPIYYGNENDATALIPTGISVSGGMVSLHPYIFYFGNDGRVQWTNANSPTELAGNARVTDQKIIAALPVRGGTSSPAGLFWSLDSVIRCTAANIAELQFTFDTITTESSILSSKSVIEYDGIYYWAGVDRFLAYNGTVVELPNSTNLNYFFSNLNYAQRQKVWATKYSHYGEIWWHYPANVPGQPVQVECNRAVIYNVRERTWYDTAIDRSCGAFEQTFSKPVWCENVANNNNTFDVWVHEIGTDQVFDNITPPQPINFFVKSSNIAYCAIGPDAKFLGIDRWCYLDRIELDADQSQNMTFTVGGKNYPRDIEQTFDYTFTDQQQKIDVRQQRREMTLKFSSNILGGDFRMGRMLLAIKTGDGRQ